MRPPRSVPHEYRLVSAACLLMLLLSFSRFNLSPDRAERTRAIWGGGRRVRRRRRGVCVWVCVGLCVSVCVCECLVVAGSVDRVVCGGGVLEYVCVCVCVFVCVCVLGCVCVCVSFSLSLS